MCVSLPTKTLFELAGIMTLIQAQVYHSQIVLENSNISSIIQDKILSNLSPSASYQFSLGGLSWAYLAKSQSSGLYVWDDVVSSFFKQGLRTETWGRPYMPSVCPPNNKYSVLNINGLKIGEFSWKDTQDHSKWGLLDNSPVVCYGDMNRMTSQQTRGGGALCVTNSAYFALHQSIITGVDPCNT
jgi:deoxyribonuclease II